jgi:hypothetical protein
MPPNRHFPGFPPGGNGQPQATQLEVVAPFTDYQVLALMGAILMAGQPAPDEHDETGRNDQASRATERALDILKHASFRNGMGQIDTSIRTATALGRDHIRKALAEQEERERNASKILGVDGEPAA